MGIRKTTPRKKLLSAAETVKCRGAGMAAATRGRARTFRDRKRQASRMACRGKQTDKSD